IHARRSDERGLALVGPQVGQQLPRLGRRVASGNRQSDLSAVGAQAIEVALGTQEMVHPLQHLTPHGSSLFGVRPVARQELAQLLANREKRLVVVRSRVGTDTPMLFFNPLA